MSQTVNLVEAIARLSRLMRRGNQNPEQLSHMGHYVLRIIMENDGISATELAELAGVRPASSTEAVNRLEKLGYVTRARDEKDSRIKRIYMTEKARACMEEHTKIKQERNERMLSCLTAEEAKVFLATCDKLCAFLESENL